MGLPGCAGGGAGPLGLGAVLGNRNLAGAEPLFSDKEAKCLDSADQILSILYGLSSAAQNQGPPGRYYDCSSISTAFQYVIGGPEEGAGENNKGSGGLGINRYTPEQRNEIIDALIAASNRKCTRYTALLKNADGAVNAGLSVGSIITGGLGAFVGGPQAAKVLAGSSSILSGSRAAINEVYLSNLTIQVLAAAMEKGRIRIRQDITNKEDCEVKKYTLSRGIEDAFLYHNACSLSAGLAEAALSIERSQNPGLESMRDVFAQYSSLVKQASEIGKEGAPSLVRGGTPALDLKSVNDTNVKLAAAQANVTALSVSLADLTRASQKAKADLDKIGAGQDKTAAEKARADALKAEAAKLEELKNATGIRDQLADTFKSELQRLTSSVVFASPLPVRQESRQCPFPQTS